MVDAHAVENSVQIKGGPKASLSKPGLQEVRLNIPATVTAGKETVEVSISGKTWSPHRVNPADNDTRELGVKVYSVQMLATQAQNTKAFNLN